MRHLLHCQSLIDNCNIVHDMPIFGWNMYKPDSVDLKIVKLLGKDARLSSDTLAKQLNLSAATVRRRLRKLIENDLIRIVGTVDQSQFGFPLLAVITLDIEQSKLESALEEFAAQPEIRFASTITGRYDLLIVGRFRSNEHFSEFMRTKLATIEGLKNSETFICLDVKKGMHGQLG